MGIINRLKQNKKKIAAGMALSAVLVTGEQPKEEVPLKEEPKIVEVTKNIEQPQRSEAHQKIAYLDEFIAMLENGEDREQAYRKFILKMADDNAKEVIKLQKQVEKIRLEQKGKDISFLLCLILGGLLFKNDFKFNFKSANHKKSDEPYKRSKIGFHIKD